MSDLRPGRAAQPRRPRGPSPACWRRPRDAAAQYVIECGDAIRGYEEQLVAETDKSAGVLLASGYIAGGALAGVVHAFLNLSESIGARLSGYEKWSTVNNRFFVGPHADLLALIPLAGLTVLLYLVGREKILRPRSSGG